MGYNPDEIEEILKRYTSDASSSQTIASSDASTDAGKDISEAKESVPSFDASELFQVKEQPEAKPEAKPEPKQEQAPSKLRLSNSKTQNTSWGEDLSDSSQDEYRPSKFSESKKTPDDRIHFDNSRRVVFGKKTEPEENKKTNIENASKESANRESANRESTNRESTNRESTSAKSYNSETIETNIKNNEKNTVKNTEKNTDSSESSDNHRVSRAEIMKQSKADARKRSQAKQRRKKRVNTILNILLVFFILVFVGSVSYLGYYFYKIHKAQNSFDNLKAMIKDERSVNPETGEDDHNPEANYITYDTIDGVEVQSKFVDIYNANNEFIGWLTIPDTNVDYPVMYTPNDEQKYLHLDFDQNYSSSGTLFVAKDANPTRPSDNVLIYGHNMKAGTMFHSLLSYEKEDFYKEHSKFYFDTLSDNGTYEVIAAFRTKIDESDDTLFKYYECFDFNDETSFNSYVENAKSMTPYTIPTTAEYGDKLLTLSTCAYHTNEGRYVIVAKKVKK